MRTARIRQWPKNLLVFAAPGAAGVLTHPGPLLRTLVAFAVFCAVASGTYFINDAVDAEADRAAPDQAAPAGRGRGREQATGLASVGGLWPLRHRRRHRPWTGGWVVVVVIYVAVQLAYSLYLKHQPIFDLAAVAAGFVLRAIAGAVAVPVPISRVVPHRRHLRKPADGDRQAAGRARRARPDRGTHRPTLDEYSPAFLRTVLAISAGGAIIGYCLWAFSLQTALTHHRDPIWYQLSIVPMIIALLRYTFLVEGGKGAKPEELVFSDRPLQVLGVRLGCSCSPWGCTPADA